jgi:hypothetical protein
MSSAGGAVVAKAKAGVCAGTPHVLAVDDSSVDRAVIAAILRGSRFRGEWLRFRLAVACFIPFLVFFI